MSVLHVWQAKWGIPAEAIIDLQRMMGIVPPELVHATPEDQPKGLGKSEAYADSLVMLEASEKGVLLLRNNVGALKDSTGRQVRYGLANESKAVNSKVKSGDRIGIRRRLIQPQDVGTYIGQFVSREIKKPGWVYSGTDHEQAQRTWLDLIIGYGGDAAFATGPGTL